MKQAVLACYFVVFLIRHFVQHIQVSIFGTEQRVESDLFSLAEEAKPAAGAGLPPSGPRQNPGPARMAQLGANAQRQWHRVNNSTQFCWTCHSRGHSCKDRLGTI